MDDGVTSRLADHQIGPLYDDDAGEESCVTRELEHLALRVRLQKRRVTNNISYETNERRSHM